MLKLENIHVSYGKTTILHDISLDILPGEIVGIIGPNGCGKTTLLNAVSGFIKNSSGSLLFNENDITGFSAHHRAVEGIGRSFQQAGVFKEMTVEENLMLAIEHKEKYPWWWRFSRKMRNQADRQICDLLSDVNLLGHKKSVAGVLSGGQLRLLELLRLRISGGKLLLIDEPTAGVAPVMRQELASLIKSLMEDESRSIIIVEHDLKFLFSLVDRVIVLVDGEKYIEGDPESIKKDKRLQEVYFGTES
ncbi:ATP-binding cassette domain-containing protein [Candidatus Peregrinibacteria bacterium]|nr:ATP-binding cassette domain-containing protein [Candidatus Peregrinibacteria bacterium]